MIQIQVNSQELERIDDGDVVRQSIQYLQCKFTFSSDWDDVSKKALFWKCDETTVYDADINNDGIAQVPDNVANENPFYISVVGVRMNGDTEVKRITTNKVKVKNKTAGYSNNISDSSITPPTQYDKFLGNIQTLKEDFESKYEAQLGKLEHDLVGHIMNDWVHTTDEDAIVYNREKRVVDYTKQVELKPFVDTFADYFETHPGVWSVKTVDDKVEYETEYYFEMNISQPTTDIELIYNDETIDDLIWIGDTDYTTGHTYAFYIRDGIVVVEDRGE